MQLHFLSITFGNFQSDAPPTELFRLTTVSNERNRIVFQNTNINVRQKCWFFWSLDQQVLVKAETKKNYAG